MTVKTAAIDPAQATEWKNLEPLYKELLERPLRCEGCLKQLLLDRSAIDAAAQEAYANLFIAMTCHTDDAGAKQRYLDFVEHVAPNLKTIGFEIDKKIATSEHVGALEPQRFEVLLRDTKTDVGIFRPANVPLQTQDTKLAQQYSEICGAMTVEFRGKERTLPQMGRFLEEIDRPTREEAWRLVAQRRFDDREKLDDLYDGMVALRHEIARNAGFENYRDYAFEAKHRFDYSPEDCQTFHQSVERVFVPVLRALNASRATALDVAPLRPWDLAVDAKGRPPLKPFDGADELVSRSSRVFHKLDPELGKLFDVLQPGDDLDLESRKGKAPGGYQENRQHARRPFIFMNAVGLHRDLETMVHEAGHAFHSLLCKHDALLHYRSSPLEFAEVASMSMELLTLEYLDEFYQPEEQSRAARQQFEGIITMLPWIATVDAFQHWVYTHPDHTRAHRTAFWLSLDERFGSMVSWEGLEQFREVSWQRQLHIFEVPFYYIEYGIAQLGALQLWLNYRKDREAALSAYKRGLALGGSRPLPELFDAAGIKLRFDESMMRELMDAVQGELEKLPV
jgi:oligoendopeptidase F